MTWRPTLKYPSEVINGMSGGGGLLCSSHAASKIRRNALAMRTPVVSAIALSVVALANTCLRTTARIRRRCGVCAIHRGGLRDTVVMRRQLSLYFGRLHFRHHPRHERGHARIGACGARGHGVVGVG